MWSLNWGTGWSRHSGPRGPTPAAASPQAAAGAEPEGRMHLPRKLLLQLPQALPSGLHVPQELGYLIVLGFAQLHASHRWGCAEAAGEARDAPGGEGQKASDGGAENRGNPGALAATSPARRQPRAAAAAAARSSAPRPVRGGARGRCERPSRAASSAQSFRRAALGPQCAPPDRPGRRGPRPFLAESGLGMCSVWWPAHRFCEPARCLRGRKEQAARPRPAAGPRCWVSAVCRSARAGRGLRALLCNASKRHFQGRFHKSPCNGYFLLLKGKIKVVVVEL